MSGRVENPDIDLLLERWSPPAGSAGASGAGGGWWRAEEKRRAVWPAPVTSASEGRPQSAGVIGPDPATRTLHEGTAGTTMHRGAGAPDAWSLCG